MGEKKQRAPQSGMALEMDVMKKIAHQLDRLLDATAGQRVLTFVQHALESKKLIAITGAVSTGLDAGQLGLLRQYQGNMAQQQHPRAAEFGLIE